jgi:hypothetical protein
MHQRRSHRDPDFLRRSIDANGRDFIFRDVFDGAGLSRFTFTLATALYAFIPPKCP